MAPTLHASGTLSATVGATPDTLVSIAVAGSFQLIVDPANMVAGDTIIVRALQVVLTGGTLRVAWPPARLADAPAADDALVVMDWVSNDLVESNAVRFTLNQATGTSRNFPWKVLKL